MKINVLINGGPYSSQAGYSAYRFVRAALDVGHEITQVFFHQDAALHANALTTVMSDEFDATDEWAKLAEAHELPLVVCVSAAERRGILGSEQAAELDKLMANLRDNFAIQGLGALHQACLDAERTVTFQ